MNVKMLKKILEGVPDDAVLVVETKVSGTFRPISPLWHFQAIQKENRFYDMEPGREKTNATVWVWE